jgi:hypothetical protein
MRKTLAACVVTALLVGGGTATAAKFVTGADVKNGSLTGKDIENGSLGPRDIRKGSIGESRLSDALQARLGTTVSGSPGAAGSKGDKGEKGDKGDKGDPGPKLSSGHWGVVDRNTIGSPVADLRAGPFSGSTVKPPFGDGSLSLIVGSGTEKAAYGNEVDFAGDRVADLTKVGFSVFTTGENAAAGNPNMPSITFEIDPNLTTTPSNFSSLVFVPAENSPANQWSGYIDATTTGKWGLTGAAGTATGCPLSGGLCTFAQIKAALDDGGDVATILTAAVGKGRDFAWQGAVDGLTINDDVFDFEESGVFVR